MPSINSFADVVLDWEGLLAALVEYGQLDGLLESERLALEGILSEARSLKARQELHNALRQELTQKIKDVVARGKEVAITIRAVAKGKIGYRSERLVQFKVAPVRRRVRKTPTVTPPDPEPVE